MEEPKAGRWTGSPGPRLPDHQASSNRVGDDRQYDQFGAGEAAKLMAMFENDLHVPVQALLGGRWVAGEAVAERRIPEGSANSQVLLEHHGHLEWIDAALVRRVLVG